MEYGITPIELAIVNASMPAKKEIKGCGCASVPFSVILVILGISYWRFAS